MERERLNLPDRAVEVYKDYVAWQKRQTVITVSTPRLLENIEVIYSPLIPIEESDLMYQLQERRDLPPVIQIQMSLSELDSLQYLIGASVMKDTIEEGYTDAGKMLPPLMESKELLSLKLSETLVHVTNLKNEGKPLLHMYEKRFRSMARHTQPAFRELHMRYPSLLENKGNQQFVAGLVDTLDLYNMAERKDQGDQRQNNRVSKGKQ